MPIYQTRGELPRKRHQVLRRPDGELYREELVGNYGFNGPSSLLYHTEQPTAVVDTRWVADMTPVQAPSKDHRNRHFRTSPIPPAGNWVQQRTPLLFNDDVIISIARPTEAGNFCYRNGEGDELLYVADGEGVLETAFGLIEYRREDYLVIPRGIVHRLVPKEGVEHRVLVHEFRGHVTTPRRYKNQQGQLKEGSPFSERDLRTPTDLFQRSGPATVMVKHAGQLHEYSLAHHPFDVVGWDGYYFPFAFNARDFEPLVGRYHLPPPVHQTFEVEGAVICTFAPRPFDFGEGAIPAPYAHSNAMSDEVIFYASKEFMSRKGVEYGSITLHPDGIPHGPQPSKTEASIGATWTDELAIMCDTFRPLKVAEGAVAFEDDGYFTSWVK
jgi:homogentisate 1,2-dioxygenase